MAEQNSSTRLQEELDGALHTLESSLASAARAASTIRSVLPQISALAEVIGDVEAAVTRIRPQLTTSTAAGLGESPWLHALPKDQPVPTPAGEPPAPEPQPASEAPRWAEQEPAVEDKRPAEAEALGGSHCLRLEVTTQASSLDLKEVDGAVNETADVVDVALLDYDGRRASLKVWLNEASDPQQVREKLLESLQRRLEGEADVRISFEEKPAA